RIDGGRGGADRHRPGARSPRGCRRGRGAGPRAEEEGAALSTPIAIDEKALLKTGALQNAILNSANFSIIATDEKGVIQLFNIGAETTLGYAAVEAVDKITPADIHDPHAGIQRAQA